MSTSQRAVMLCGLGVKAGIVTYTLLYISSPILSILKKLLGIQNLTSGQRILTKGRIARGGLFTWDNVM